MDRAPYCSRTRKSSLTKVVPLTLLLTALVLGGMGLLNGGGVSGLVTGVIGGLVFGLVICGIYLAVLMPSLSPRPVYAEAGAEHPGAFPE